MIAKVTSTALQEQANSFYLKAFADYGMAALFMFVTAVCVYTPPLLFFKQIASNTLYIMLAFLAVGFVFYLVRFERLMIVSFICCCVLCLHLKSSANKQMRLAPVSANPSLSVSHISLGNAENNYDSVINYLLRLDADLLSFQELTPDWNAELTRKLSEKYQYVSTMTRLDQYGMGFFSKLPFGTIDTIYFKDIPNLTCSVLLAPGTECHLISCQVVPPVNQAAFSVIEKHFAYLTDYMQDLGSNVIVLGDLHLPPWDSEVQKFKDISRLQDSRRDINPRNVDGSMSLPRIPVEHIFYCDQFECTSFSELGNVTIGRVGITGTYQLKEYGQLGSVQ